MEAEFTGLTEQQARAARVLSKVTGLDRLDARRALERFEWTQAMATDHVVACRLLNVDWTSSPDEVAARRDVDPYARAAALETAYRERVKAYAFRPKA
jgi:hypothetical protein